MSYSNTYEVLDLAGDFRNMLFGCGLPGLLLAAQQWFIITKKQTYLSNRTVPGR